MTAPDTLECTPNAFPAARRNKRSRQPVPSSDSDDEEDQDEDEQELDDDDQGLDGDDQDPDDSGELLTRNAENLFICPFSLPRPEEPDAFLCSLKPRKTRQSVVSFSIFEVILDQETSPGIAAHGSQ